MANLINTKVSLITVGDIANYLRLSEVSQADTDFLGKCLDIAKRYISDYTGIIISKYVETEDTEPNEDKTYYYLENNVYVKFIGTEFDPETTYYEKIGNEDLDDHEDFVIVVYVLCQDMYDTRTLYVEKSNINKVVETILNLHNGNLL